MAFSVRINGHRKIPPMKPAMHELLLQGCCYEHEEQGHSYAHISHCLSDHWGPSYVHPVQGLENVWLNNGGAFCTQGTRYTNHFMISMFILCQANHLLTDATKDAGSQVFYRAILETFLGVYSLLVWKNSRHTSAKRSHALVLIAHVKLTLLAGAICARKSSMTSMIW